MAPNPEWSRDWGQSGLRFEEDASCVGRASPSAPCTARALRQALLWRGVCALTADLGDARGHGSQWCPGRGAGVPQGRPAGIPTHPPPARHWHREPPSRPTLCGVSGERLRGAKPRARPGRGDTPQLGVRSSPGPGSFGVQPGPPPRRAAVPGRSRPVGPTGSSLRPPPNPGGLPPAPPAWAARGLRRGVSGAERARAGPLGAVREGGGALPGPHVPRPGRPMGARRSERSPYMDMFWGRARRRSARAPRSA